MSTGPLCAGERVLLIDSKDRRYLVRLVAGGSFQTHAGILDHDEVIGRDEGSDIAVPDERGAASHGAFSVATDPLRRDPEDAPWSTGHLPEGSRRDPHRRRPLPRCAGPRDRRRLRGTLHCRGRGWVATSSATSFAPTSRPARGATSRLPSGPRRRDVVEERDAYEGIDAIGIDRVLLDLPEPWRVVGHAASALVPGGVLCAYLPSINQTAEPRAELRVRGIVLAETLEVLHRTWHIEGRSVRPDHRMVAHTGFITTARLGSSTPRRQQAVSVGLEEAGIDAGSAKRAGRWRGGDGPRCAVRARRGSVGRGARRTAALDGPRR